MERLIFTFLSQTWGENFAERWSVPMSLLAVALCAILSYIVCVKVVIPVVNFITRKTETEWDDDLLNETVLKGVAQFIPAIIVVLLLPAIFKTGGDSYRWAVKLSELYLLWASIHLIRVFLLGVQNAFDRRHLLQEHNLEIVRQTLVLFIVLVGVVVAIAILINRDPIAVLTGLGASAAILMLVFRDTILGFVAGIQLTLNKMLSRGDWIMAPKAGVNGEVMEVRLTTVKVRNWDNSIVTISPYTLFTDSFQNFQAMRASGARRVSRSVLIDQSTVRFLTDEEIEALIAEGLTEPGDLNPAGKTVNLSLLRKYMERFIANYPTVLHAQTGRPELTLMARELQPTPQGIPFELYFFTSHTVWKPFEHLQADVFDYLYAIIPHFHLAVYQAPSSRDFAPIRHSYPADSSLEASPISPSNPKQTLSNDEAQSSQPSSSTPTLSRDETFGL